MWPFFLKGGRGQGLDERNNCDLREKDCMRTERLKLRNALEIRRKGTKVKFTMGKQKAKQEEKK